MTRFWDGQTDGRTAGRSDCTPRPAFAFGDAGKKHENKFRIRTVSSFVKISHCFVSKNVEYSLWFYKKLLNSKFPPDYRWSKLCLQIHLYHIDIGWNFKIKVYLILQYFNIMKMLKYIHVIYVQIIKLYEWNLHIIS